MSKAESYPGPSQTSKMERFAKIVKKSCGSSRTKFCKKVLLKISQN